MISRSICNLKIDTICMCDTPFDRSILQLSNGIRHVMPSTERKLELTAKSSMAQPVSQPAVCSNGLIIYFYSLFTPAFHCCLNVLWLYVFPRFTIASSSLTSGSSFIYICGANYMCILLYRFVVRLFLFYFLYLRLFNASTLRCF
jgi:hypothetical protein